MWPNVMLQWEWLGGLPPLRRAAVIGAGSWGTSVAVMLARAGLEVDLGTRTHEQAEQLAATRVNERYLPGVELPAAINPVRAADLELSRHDLVVLRRARRRAARHGGGARRRHRPARGRAWSCPRASCRRSARCPPPSSASA